MHIRFVAMRNRLVVSNLRLRIIIAGFVGWHIIFYNIGNTER